MRILQICKKFPYPLKDGEVIGIWMYSKGFHYHRHAVTILAMNTHKHFSHPELVPNNWKNIADIKSVDVNTNVHFGKVFLNLFRKSCYNIDRFYSQKFVHQLIQLLQTQEFDLIQLEGVYLSQYVSVIRKYSKAKIVLRTQNVEFKIWEREANSETFLKKKYLELMARRMKTYELNLLNLYDAIVPVSCSDGEIFKSVGCKIPMQVCEHGVDTNAVVISSLNSLSSDCESTIGQTQDDKRTEEFSVFHIGSMDWRPNLLGLEWFLENCWPIILKEIPEAKLYLAGRNFPNSWKKKIIQNVVMVGEVENAASFIQSKQVMICPLHAGSGIRVKLMEGMSFGKAIVSTTIGAEGLPVENGKNIFIADDAFAFSNSVIQLLSKKELRNSFETEARKLAEQKFDYRVLISDLLNFYSELVKK